MKRLTKATISESSKNELADINGLGEIRKSARIRAKVKKKFRYPDDEIAILRKAVAYLFNIVEKLHEGELTNSEFAEYNAFVERIKSEVKADNAETV